MILQTDKGSNIVCFPAYGMANGLPAYSSHHDTGIRLIRSKSITFHIKPLANPRDRVASTRAALCRNATLPIVFCVYFHRRHNGHNVADSLFIKETGRSN